MEKGQLLIEGAEEEIIEELQNQKQKMMR